MYVSNVEKFRNTLQDTKGQRDNIVYSACVITKTKQNIQTQILTLYFLDFTKEKKVVLSFYRFVFLNKWWYD